MPTPPQAGSLLHQTDDSPKSADPTVRPTNSNRQLTGHTRTVFPVPLRPVDYFPKRKASYCSGLAVSAAIRPPVSLITTTKTGTMFSYESINGAFRSRQRVIMPFHRPNGALSPAQTNVVFG